MSKYQFLVPIPPETLHTGQSLLLFLLLFPLALHRRLQIDIHPIQQIAKATSDRPSPPSPPPPKNILMSSCVLVLKWQLWLAALEKRPQFHLQPRLPIAIRWQCPRLPLLLTLGNWSRDEAAREVMTRSAEMRLPCRWSDNCRFDLPALVL